MRKVVLENVRAAARELGYYLVPIPNRDQTHCKRGHPLSGDNLYPYRGKRGCRTCRREADRRRNVADDELYDL